MHIKGIVKKDKRTKQLINRLKHGEIALIDHKDLDEIGAISLAEKKIQCVININHTISGKYPNLGPSILSRANIPIFESEASIFERIEEGDTIEIIENIIIYRGKRIASCHLIDGNRIEELLNVAYMNIEQELDQFIENTLEYARREKGLVTGKVLIPRSGVDIKGRHVLVVVRGRDYKKDLRTIRSYINEVRPVLIGVDGGGDALLEFGYTPDIIIGDMDSITDVCLKSANEIIVHAYANGEAPGLKRVKDLGLNATLFKAPGTSEDVALLLAYDNGADLIVAVGSHTNMIDFLEKGRGGMSSTFLVRLKVGSILVDAKGVNKLYQSSFKFKYILGIALSAFIPVLVIATMHPLIRELLSLIRIRIKFLMNL